MTFSGYFIPFVGLVSIISGSPAQAEMVLSKVVVDLGSERPPRDDIEIWNNGPERLYVLSEAAEILDPGTPKERRISPGADSLDLLVSPQRVILEPGERRMLRIAALAGRPQSERVYRVAIRPVAGTIASSVSALKIFVGYDILVLVRPQIGQEQLEVSRLGDKLIVRNTGTVSQELFQGKQCSDDGSDCRQLPAKRLYPGAYWDLALPFSTKVSFKVAVGQKIRDQEF